MNRFIVFLISASILFIIVFGLLTVYTTQSVVFMPEIESEMMDQMSHKELTDVMQSRGKTLGFMENLQFQIGTLEFWSQVLRLTFWGVLVSTLAYGIAMKWGKYRK
ncbi:hypothetical protein GCM10011365_24600 [Marinicella pacifica]|uniref:Uncharacterized protein n=1 Tax=Marinicella pacifica TaxID=1171543 RepID=A0A917CY62_9GAMM|nr:hypothetical protein [Marinicella pacifica]GGG02491.1 hypothetical protein GCM10011365_24600 [Marinicella pacifica]